MDRRQHTNTFEARVVQKLVEVNDAEGTESVPNEQKKPLVGDGF